MQVREYGPSALLVEVDSAGEAAALADWLRRVGERLRCEEIVPAARTVLLDGLRRAEDVARWRALLETWTPREDRPPGPLVELPTRYDGPDLERVAGLWRVTPAEVVARHTALEFVSAFCGFAPGFAYLTGLPPGWVVPRLAAPRPRVPAGSVGLADGFCGVYPSASPGGWLLLGRTEAVLWDLSSPEPALLAPGTRVRFVAVG
ncbi:MAG: allophanate hydrolase subunit 1 [Nocardioides sp.]|uniref:5-oxoprolinase subunit B family protein n=1 Tax=Nocardioides sp. TaxID=35761 RepID=UPI0039E31A61